LHEKKFKAQCPKRTLAMNLLKLFKQPEYFFRPHQVVLKLGRTVRAHREFEDVTLPWGATMRIRPGEHIGSRIWHRGVFDLVVLEAIARLIEPGESALDIGANIGQMTNLMSHRAGGKGRVLSFEPHPAIFAQLSENVGRLKQRPDCAPVLLHNLALSDFEGTARLSVGEGWGRNQGLARLTLDEGGEATFEVPVTTLDKVVGSSARFGLCKLDVEGHELKVLHGAKGVLGGGRLRDIIFEDLGPYPGPVQQHLMDNGFTLFSLEGRLGRPVLNADWANPRFDGDMEGADFLATLEPERAISRFKAGGWVALH
jgi:FkbM family methyltransferase